jgi:hypothetical protein
MNLVKQAIAYPVLWRAPAAWRFLSSSVVSHGFSRPPRQLSQFSRGQGYERGLVQ